MEVKDVYEDADELFEQLVEEHGFQKVAPINVDKVAELLGIKVRYEFGPDGQVGRIEFSEGSPQVSINIFENSFEPRQRFTLAHEIGHFCLHRGEGAEEFVDTRNQMSRSGSYWDTYEYEANTFAAELLMPRDLVLRDGNKIIEKYLEETGKEKIKKEKLIDLLASHFQVSNPAMAYRLKNLGFVK
ncbi:hypothetical protein ATO7_08892 [Oceanococcus atlanticus]|uniref:IrrE N-terminal-like domain-containing protein n=1 Tax=Oceanococcus atlanticus TaxID=1317117 RepID=A0A1Y1SEM9_9GAMM|nr:ImmA/IrrE family metallo-endopeptidase [Oceanococcus atlanticus]ORE87144.1 hypothetical protein ATO7_08892 [Oceanococcus atlanticus]